MIRLTLEQRQTRIPMLGVISPLLALAMTLTIGALMFAALGKPPISALYIYFIEPLTEIWSIHELLIKAAPL
ncbi:MAG: ABC transporter permease, partial [Pseudomonadota bacterium]